MSYYKQMRYAEKCLKRSIEYSRDAAKHLATARDTVDAPKNSPAPSIWEEAEDLAKALEDAHTELSEYLGRESQ